MTDQAQTTTPSTGDSPQDAAPVTAPLAIPASVQPPSQPPPSDQPPPAQPPPPQPPPIPPFTASTPTDAEMPITKYAVIALVAVIVTIVIGLLIAIIGGVVDSAGVANFFRILRDFFIIVLALQGILISIALIILILQVSALINLLRNEIKPIVDETREAMTTIRGTAEFLSRNVATPVIRTTAALTTARAFLREITGLRRNVLGTGKSSNKVIPKNGEKKP